MRLNVGVVFGGKTVEHEVSIISALQMMENMNEFKYDPIPIYLSKENEFLYHEEMKKIDFFKDLDKVKKLAKRITLIKNNEKTELYIRRRKKLKRLCEVDILFLVVHGAGCEDGTISSLCELYNIPYVGSSILPSALNQNKWKQKALFSYHKIPIVPFVGFYDEDYYKEKDDIIKECEKLGFPLIVKPANLGSSVGIKKCKNIEELNQAIIEAMTYDSEIIVEKVIDNLIELNCSVLGNYNYYETSSIERVFQIDEILSYQDKYLRGSKSTKGMESTNRELPAKISDNLRQEIEKLSIKAAKIIGGSGVMRIDYLYDNKNKKLYLNEINTIPGSLAYYLWREKGKDYSSLIDDLINIALKSYRIKNSKIYSYESNLLALAPLSNYGKLRK